ncbi:peptidylprolyl isomerase [bacterium]|nr:peptidylprolyl isomerase [bacterium]MBU1026003.1 peptidylprolyl isomerase [bacterium]
MRNSIIFLVMTVIMISFISIACSGENASADKNAKKDDEASNAPQKLSQAGELENAGGLEPGINTSQDGQSTTAAGETTATVNEDGTTTIRDSSGNVIETTQTVDGVAQTSSGLANSGSTPSLDTNSGPGLTDASAPPNAGAPPSGESVDKSTLTRGSVNIKDKVAIMKTNFGDMYIFFYTDAAPNHVRNFIYLAEKGFFKMIKFHRIKKGFMAQAGIARADWTEEIPPLKLEIDPKLEAKHIPGAFSAARTSDLNSATSQFFLVFNREGAKHLDSQYSVYGQVFKGFDVLEKIEGIKIGPNPQMGGEMSKPLQDVIILDVVIEDGAKYKPEIDKWKAQNS